MAKTIGIIAIKGGVGKTSVAASLACDLVNHHGKKVLLVDGNYSAPNLGLHMDIVKPGKTIHDVLVGGARINSAVHSSYGVDVIPGSYFYSKQINPLKLKDKLSKIKENYDFVILDSSPNMNDEALSAIVSSDALFVVSTPDYPTMSCSLIAAKLAKQRGRPIAGIILNKIRDPDYELSVQEVEESTDIPVVAKIPDEDVHVRSLFSRIPVSIYDRSSKFAKEIHALSAVLTRREEKQSFLQKLFSFNLGKEHVNRQLLKGQFYTAVFGENRE